MMLLMDFCRWIMQVVWQRLCLAQEAMGCGTFFWLADISPIDSRL